VKRMMLAMVVIAMIVGCTSKETIVDVQKKKLKIAFPETYSASFVKERRRYIELFEAAHPHIHVQLVSGAYVQKNILDGSPIVFDEFIAMLKGVDPPDVVVIGENSIGEFQSLLNENMLSPLDTFILKSGFDKESLAPNVLKMISQLAPDSNTYALAPLFSTPALYYNKKLFKKLGIQYPEQNMSWEQVMLLASEIRRKQYGGLVCAVCTLFSLSSQRGVSMYSKMKMKVNSKEWKRIFNDMVEMKKERERMAKYDEQDVPFELPDDFYAFLAGKLAMYIGTPQTLHVISEYNQTLTSKEEEQLDVGVVTAPVYTERPDIGFGIKIDGLMGINKNAQNPDIAWEFIEFIHGEQWARLRSSSVYEMLPTRMSVLESRFDLDSTVFTKLLPSPTGVNDEIILGVGEKLLDEVTAGKMTVDNALQKWENEGNSLLAQ
jgi:multiple sugar transport system substrate-binding protein